MEDASQDLFGPGSEACSDSETPDLLVPDPQPAVTLPQPAAPPGGPHRSPATLPHAGFLQSLCALHRVTGNNRGLELLWFGPDGGAGSVLADSVCQLLDSVVAACRDPPPPLGPGDLVLQACRVAARAMDLFCSQRLPSAEFTRRVEESLRELTRLLLHSEHISRVSEGSKHNVSVSCGHSWKITNTGGETDP